VNARLPAILVLALGLAGCFSLGGSPEEIHEYDLRPVVDALAVAPLGTAVTIEVEPFGIDEALDRDAIVWRRGAVVGPYVTHRWARPPQRAVREAVAGALQAALGPAATVATEPALADADLVLRGYLARCEEVDDDGSWSGAIELRVTLGRRDGVELLRKIYAETERAAARNPLGVVLALDRALARIGREVAGDVARAGHGSPVRPGAGTEELR